MTNQKQIKNAISFIDGQNLYHCAREAFSVSHPNYDVVKLSQHVCTTHGWHLKQVRFYTGYPSSKDDPYWANFWQKKLLAISRQGVHKFARQLRYRNKTIHIGDGATVTREVGEEKGIDVRIAVDLIKLAFEQTYDVAIVFSQDQDLSEATDEVKRIAQSQGRFVDLACAFPVGAGTLNKRGINNTQWFQIDEGAYNACLDPNDYR